MSEPVDDRRHVSELPAFDRVQARPEPEPPRRLGWLWLGLLLLMLVGVGGTAWWLWPDEDAERNVLVHLVDTAEAFRPDLVTTRPEEARALVLDVLGWDVLPPDLPALAVVGAGVPSIGHVRPTATASPAAVQTPAFRYEGADGEHALVFAYDYILLDRVGRDFDLPEGTYAGLSEPVPVDSRVVEGRFVVTWRERAMIFSAVTPFEAVAERIRQAVAS